MGLIPVVVAGCGPGGPEFLTPQVCNAALEAEVLASVPRLLELFPDARGIRVAYGDGLETFLEALSPHLGHRRVVVLVTGDPGLASLASTLTRRFPKQSFRRLAGLSSVQVAFAEAGLDWMDARIIRAHGSLPPWDTAWEAHRGPFAILAGADGAATFAAELATRLGRPFIWCCERLGMADQRVTRPSPAELKTCDPLSVLIVEGEIP